MGFGLTVPTALLTNSQRNPPGSAAPNAVSMSVELSSTVMNTFWLNFRDRRSACAEPSSYPRLCDLDPGAVSVLPGTDVATSVFNPIQDSWKLFRMQQYFFANEPFVGEMARRFAAVGPAAYIPYLREWMDAVSRMSSEEIILDSRAFVSYQNISSAQAVGGFAALMREKR